MTSIKLRYYNLIGISAIVTILLLSGCHSSSSATKATEAIIAVQVITDDGVDTTGLSAAELQLTNLSEIDATGLTYSISDEQSSPTRLGSSQFFALYNGSNAYKNWCRGSSCDNSCSNLANDTLQPLQSCTLYVRALKVGAVDSTYQAQLTITGDDLDHTQTLTLSNQLALVAGGDFTAANDDNNTPMNYVAEYHNGQWQALGQSHGGGFTDTVFALRVDGSGNLLAGGEFTTTHYGTSVDHIAEYHNGQWQAIGQGSGGFNDTVHTILMDNEGNLFAGGDFTESGNGATLNLIGEYANGQWQAVGQGNGGGFTLPQEPEDATVETLLKDSAGDLIAGGNFTQAGDGTPMNNIAQYNDDNSEWQQMGADYEYDDEGETITVLGGGILSSNSGSSLGMSVLSLALDDSETLIAGGTSLIRVGVNTAIRQITQYDSENDLWERAGSTRGFAPINSHVHALTTDSADNLFAAGTMTGVWDSGTLVEQIAERVNGDWEALGTDQDSGVDNDVYALTADNAGNLFLAGRFSCSVPVDPVAHRATTVTTQRPKGVQDIPAACSPSLGQAVGDGGNYTLMSFVGEYSSDKTWHPLGQGEDGAGLNNWTYALTTVPLLTISKN